MGPTGRDAGAVLRRLVIAVAVLLALLVAADRVGDVIAERAAADTIQNDEHLSQRPSVDVTGFPFLTQLASGNFGQIVITAHDVPVGNGAIHLNVSGVVVTLNHVHVSRSFSNFHARTAQAVATISYDDLGNALGVVLTYQGGGRVTATKSVTVAGQTLQASVTAAPQISHGVLSFGKVEINNLGALGRSIGASVTSLLNGVFDVSIPLAGIPFHVRVRSLSLDSSGLHIRLSGADLSYAR